VIRSRLPQCAQGVNHAGHLDPLGALQKQHIATVHTVGPLMAHLHAALPGALRGLHAESADEMVAALPATLVPGDVLLLKGSKGIKVSRVVDALRKLGQAAADHRRGPR
jgi:UDP-N-acetylmuramoyl-tripeptide--D-alanyl-D-alanine ligase